MIETSLAHSKKREGVQLAKSEEVKERGQPGHRGLANMGKDWVCISNAMGKPL